ncbi:MAG: porin, partial [Prevotellamassilia sp.]|nr:porin [Prevotellamassilia sp.]
MKSILTLALCATTSLATFAETLHPGEKEGTTFNLATQKAPEAIKKADPTITVGGFITGKYSINDKKNTTENGGFEMRYLRIYGSGYVYKDFFYRFQGEVSGAPGVDKGARLLDAFVEWQKYDAFRVKVGQFKRSFGFENPMSPLAIGHGAYSQATLKFLMNDRCGEHSSGGRDLGAQIQGDLFKV